MFSVQLLKWVLFVASFGSLLTSFALTYYGVHWGELSGSKSLFESYFELLISETGV